MNYIEYGKEHTEVIVLLHGGGLSWWNYREVAEKLSTDYRVILPILDGHSECHHDFISIEENAARIDYIRMTIEEWLSKEKIDKNQKNCKKDVANGERT